MTDSFSLKELSSFEYILQKTMTAALHDPPTETKSQTSYKSTPTSRSSVLSRAREYTRKMEDEAEQRARSMERTPTNGTPRSHSNGRSTPQKGGTSMRDRALASVERDTPMSGSHHQNHPETPGSVRTSGDMTLSTQQTQQTRSATPKTQQGSQSTRPSFRNRSAADQHGEAPPEAVVSPELLVDALSGHEDGLLAIAERLMEHYDRGYDAMGEAIIDAFADVQKLFQHVVEAAHMEGAAFEASRREEEMKELRKQAAEGGGLLSAPSADEGDDGASPSGPIRHDEFVDQDVKDCLTEAIRKGTVLKESNRHAECFDLYEEACQSASALLPVDSDHRGRLQLSIARAESMSPDRACAILRYAMDDVLRSSRRAGKVPLPDPSKRSDVVLSKPKAHPSMSGSTSQASVVQSSEEQMNSLVQEMKEILEAPVYKDTPLQDVAKRFFVTLGENQKIQNKNEERLEHNLGKLKGDFLLARAEWEEKLTRAEENSEKYKQKYLNLKENKEAASFMEEARNMSQRLVSGKSEQEDEHSMSFMSQKSGGDRAKRAESIASLGSSMAHHARTLVGQFACAGMNEHTGTVLATELAEGNGQTRQYGSRDNSNLKAYATAYGLQQARSFQETQRNAEV